MNYAIFRDDANEYVRSLRNTLIGKIVSWTTILEKANIGSHAEMQCVASQIHDCYPQYKLSLVRVKCKQ